MTATAAGPAAGMRGYRAVLAVPGVGALCAVALLARVPATAAAITLTLHVVITLDHGYTAAGLIGGGVAVGMAVGAPLLGRLVDRRGLRTMLTVTVGCEALFWSVAPWLSFPLLLVGAFLGGLLGLPVFTVVRQSLAAMVVAEQRRPAFALDSMSVELSYILGPATGTLIALQFSTTVAMWSVGAGFVLSGVTLWLLNPPVRSASTSEAGNAATPRFQEWLDARLAATLLATAAAVAVLLGSELAVIASLQISGQATWIAVVNAVWCLASLAGGFGYGAARRSGSLFLLVGGLGAATLPMALGGPWWTFALLLVPAGLLCAPSLAASAEAVTALAPEPVRGLVTGLHGSAITLGAAAGIPVAGLLIDAASPAAAILTLGTTGIVVAALAALLARRRPRPSGHHPGRPASPALRHTRRR